jgi:ADP-ribose diphosphatase
MPRELVYTGRRIQVAQEIVHQPDGSTLRRDVVLHPGAVAILPLTDPDHVCLLRNYRVALGETLWEIPAGTLEPGEPPTEAAVRELEEETGYRAGRWARLGELIPSPGVMSEVIHLFLAEELTPGPARPEPGEELEAHTVPWDQALLWAMDGTIRDAKTLIALFHLERLRRGLSR